MVNHVHVCRYTYLGEEDPHQNVPSDVTFFPLSQFFALSDPLQLREGESVAKFARFLLVHRHTVTNASQQMSHTERKDQLSAEK